jgi:DNA-binding XRE family transcriptional regulator
MDHQEFASLRKFLKKTQREMAQLLGISLKAVHSYEQGWRQIPPNVERQMLFLYALKKRLRGRPRLCWTIKKCPKEQRSKCPAWEFRTGHFCWFINGTICVGRPQRNWQEKIKICRRCPIFLKNWITPIQPGQGPEMAPQTRPGL